MRAYERLLKYVKVWTTSDPESGTHPSTMRQFDLAHQLVQELKDLGLTDAHVDEHCYVYATLPATPGQESAKPLGFIAHMDTADDASGENVNPQISYENFNAAAAVVTVHGFSVHPGSAKNTMINAQNVAMEFHAALPAFSRPEHTEGREGFFHLTSMVGDVTTAKLGYIVRDHDAAKFAARKAQMEHIAACLNERYGEGTVELDIHDSYHNMLEKIQPHFHLVENARKAIRAAGLEPIETPVRGGTDGATLSYMGLPCPNLGTGGFNFHGPCECITAEKMDQCTEILLNLVDLYK